jgi:hypothetical protein
MRLVLAVVLLILAPAAALGRDLRRGEYRFRVTASGASGRATRTLSARRL